MTHSRPWLAGTVSATAAAKVVAGALGPIVITAPRLERDRLHMPAAIDRVDRREVHKGRAPEAR